MDDTTRTLLTDALAALEDLGACQDQNCSEPNCLHIIARYGRYLGSNCNLQSELEWFDKNARLPGIGIDGDESRSRHVLLWIPDLDDWRDDTFVDLGPDPDGTKVVEPSKYSWSEFSHWAYVVPPGAFRMSNAGANH